MFIVRESLSSKSSDFENVPIFRFFIKVYDITTDFKCLLVDSRLCRGSAVGDRVKGFTQILVDLIIKSLFRTHKKWYNKS